MLAGGSVAIPHLILLEEFPVFLAPNFFVYHHGCIIVRDRAGFAGDLSVWFAADFFVKRLQLPAVF